MNKINFEFSDTISGYISKLCRDIDTFILKTSDNREYAVKFSSETNAWIANNLNEPRQSCGGQMRDMLEIGRHVFVYGIFYPDSSGYTIEAQYLIFSGGKKNEFLFEKQDWWVKQIQALGEFWLKAQFGGQEIDYTNSFPLMSRFMPWPGRCRPTASPAIRAFLKMPARR